MSTELPFKTAPELVRELSRDCGIRSDIQEQAERASAELGGVDGSHIGKSPSVIAATCLWLIANRCGQPVTQKEVSDPVGCSEMAIRAARDEIQNELEDLE